MTKTVMATQQGTYGHIREYGDVFELTDDAHFSKRWMVEVGSAEQRALQKAATKVGEAEVHVVDTSIGQNPELEKLRAELAEKNAEIDRLKSGTKSTGKAGSTVKTKEPTADADKTAAEVLAMANDSNVEFMTFKAAARKILGEDTPATKAEIIAALEDKATQP